MPSTLLDSRLYGDLFSTSAMRAVFSDTATLHAYVEAEIALALAEGELGLIPAEAARTIADQARSTPFDFAKLGRESELVGYPIVPLVKQITAHCGEAGKYLHWGATTQDIIDTGLVLQVRAALDLLEIGLQDCANSLRRLALRYRDTPMPGRTHLQHALPITFGYKAAVWLSAVERNQERLAQLRPRVLVGQFAGAAGTLASLGTRGLDVQAGMMRHLNLGIPKVAWHSTRDTLAETVQWLGLVTASLAKIAVDVSFMMATEIGEAFEPFVPGRGSSSTMPQKRNPISSEVIIGAAKTVRHLAGLALDASVHDFERATGPWQAEWVAVPEAFLHTSGALAQAQAMLSGLEVDDKRMAKNLHLTGGLIVAEAVMMGLAPYLGRNEAHHVVYDACRTALEQGTQLAQVLLNDAKVMQHVSAEQVRQFCDPANYLGVTGLMIDRALER
jgi:3-carboxy-cis,cis-muconate cycloisomerase